jgi:hypothetical protein
MTKKDTSSRPHTTVILNLIQDLGKKEKRHSRPAVRERRGGNLGKTSASSSIFKDCPDDKIKGERPSYSVY